jgi:hypothetical protein
LVKEHPDTAQILTLSPSVQDAAAFYNDVLPTVFYTQREGRAWLTDLLLELHLITALLWHVQGMGRERSSSAIGGITSFDLNSIRAFLAKPAIRNSQTQVGPSST